MHMKPIWYRYEKKKREESLTGFWILFGAMLLSLLGVIFLNIATLVFVIVFGFFAAIFLQGFARPRIEIMLDDCKRAHHREEELSIAEGVLTRHFLMLASPLYFVWQICSLLLILGVLWKKPVSIWFMTSFPALFICFFILIPWKEKWKDLGGTARRFWRLQMLVYLATLVLAALVFAVLLLVLGVDFFGF